jgi:hypothetical protein
VHPGVVVRELAPRSPARKVTAATIGGRAVAPAADAMVRILREVAERYPLSPQPAAEAPSPAG